MIYTSDIKLMLEDIKEALSLRHTINEPMVEAWYRALKHHKPEMISKAKVELIDNWTASSFPKPAEFRQYLSLAYSQEGSVQEWPTMSDVLPKQKSKVRKLMETSQRNIDALTKNTPKIKCAKCDKWALRNLTANAYFEYYDHPIIDGMDGAYLCGGHTDDLIEFLGEGNRFN